MRMKLAAGAMVALTAIAMSSTAQAGDQRALAAASQGSAQSAQAPWYERFTFGSEFGAGANAWTPRGEPRANVRVTPRSRWGVTFGLEREAQRPIDRTLGREGPTAGAFYQVSPKLRVGGAVTLPDQRLRPEDQRRDPNQRQPGVKVESAFRF